MSMVVETDLGRDMDDLLALCFMASQGVEFKVWFITPGDADQIAVAKMLRSQFGQTFPIFCSKPDRHKSGKHSSGGIHYKLLEHFDMPLFADPDPDGDFCISKDDVFVCGPVTTFPEKLEAISELDQLFMQGGFIGFDVHDIEIAPEHRLEKFEGLTEVSTFNMGGSKTRTLALLDAPFQQRTFIGKNVCHTILYDVEMHQDFQVRNEADEVFKLACDFHFEDKTHKAMHDVLASAIALDPSLGTFVSATPYCIKGKWGSTPDESNNRVLVDVDRNRLWEMITNKREEQGNGRGT